MPKTKTTNTEKKICEATLKCAATHDWPSLTHAQIAKTAKLSEAQVRKTFLDINDILPAIVRQTDIRVAAAVKKPRGAPHDRLFEVMMARFDILQSHRAAIINIMNAVKRNPSLARYLLPAHAATMQATLQLANLKQDDAKDLFATAGLLAVYAAVLCTWERDETADMSKTMAALDRHLHRAEKLADILFRVF